jgi:hypothetical protein
MNAMSTAQFYVPGPLTASRVDRTIGLRDLVLLCLAIAICCASFVFALLCKSEQNYPITPVQVSTAASRHVVTAAHSEPADLRPSSSPTHINFTLRRANSFQPVGPIQLGIWRIDARHDSVRVSILVSNRRIDLKRVGLNERVVIPATPSQMELVINGISNNQVSGYITEPIAAVQ